SSQLSNEVKSPASACPNPPFWPLCPPLRRPLYPPLCRIPLFFRQSARQSGRRSGGPNAAWDKSTVSPTALLGKTPHAPRAVSHWLLAPKRLPHFSMTKRAPILLVEDDENDIYLLRRAMEKSGL